MKRHKDQRKAITPTRAEMREQLKKNFADEKAMEFAAHEIHGGQYKAGQTFPVGENLMAESPADRILRGIEFRTKGGRQLVADRLSVEINRIAEQTWRREWNESQEAQKSLHGRIAKLEEAIRLQQRRHFEDIQSWSQGGSSIMGLAERRG